MKLAITGPLGHIGSRLIHELTPADATEVVLIDNLSTQRYCSLFNLPEGIAWKFVEADVTKADLEDMFAGSDVVIHLAAITNAVESFEKEEEVERVNYFGTQRVALAAARPGGFDAQEFRRVARARALWRAPRHRKFEPTLAHQRRQKT